MRPATSEAGSALPEIPGYRILRHVGEGGMARVYLATQLSLERQVALKVLAFEHSVSEEAALRFEREARTIAKLDHPNIVGIYDVGRTRAGELYYTMPFLANGDLAGRDLRHNPRRVVEVLSAICDALSYAHGQGVIHRDVKPENILFDQNERPRLADFGIALSSTHDHRVTGQGKAMGSTGYMSPEQARGLTLDGRTDLYSLGIVCYELITGELPFMGPDALAVAMAHSTDPIPRMPPTLKLWQPFIDKALAKNPDERFQDADQMRAGLAEIGSQVRTGGSTAVTAEYKLEGKGRKRTWLVLPLLVAIAAVAGWFYRAELQGVMTSWTQAPGSPPPSPDAIAPSEPAAPESASTTAAPAANAEAPPAAPLENPPPAGAAPAPAIIDAKQLDASLADGYALLKQGNLFGAGADNAAEHFLTVLGAAPQSAEARAGLDAVFAAAGASVEKAIAASDGARAAQLYDDASAAAAKSGIADYPGFAKFEKRYASALGALLDAAAKRVDAPPKLDALAPAIDRAAKAHPELLATRDKLLALPKPGARFADAGGPALVFVPARTKTTSVDRAFALTQTEITRGAFAAFVAATKRADGKCRESEGPLAIFRPRDWKKPGYDQDDSHPVVCVTAADADAYAEWLSRKTGRKYRVPSRAEWQHAARSLATGGDACRLGNVLDKDGAADSKKLKPYDCSDGFRYTSPAGKFAVGAWGLGDLAGNVSEWLADCAGAGCKQRAIAGASYRTGTERAFTAVDAHAADTGAPDIGFRLVRELDLDSIPK